VLTPQHGGVIDRRADDYSMTMTMTSEATLTNQRARRAVSAPLIGRRRRRFSCYCQSLWLLPVTNRSFCRHVLHFCK